MTINTNIVKDNILGRLYLTVSLIIVGAAGQTFLWGIFAPQLQSQMGFTNTDIASAIGLAVFLAAITYTVLGDFASNRSPKTLIIVALSVAAISMFSIANSFGSVAYFFILFFLIRLSTRHLLFHAMEIHISEKRAQLGGFAAFLMASAYPLTVLTIPTIIHTGLELYSLTEVLQIYAILIVIILLWTAQRNFRQSIAQESEVENTGGLNRFTLILTPKFLLLTGIYSITFCLDTAALLFHRSLFADVSSVNLLSFYAVGQILGAISGPYLASRLRQVNFMVLHLLPLLIGTIILAKFMEFGPLAFFIGLGMSVALSNYASISIWMAAFRDMEFRRVVVYRSFIATSLSALTAYFVGFGVDLDASILVLVILSLCMCCLGFIFALCLKRHLI